MEITVSVSGTTAIVTAGHGEVEVKVLVASLGGGCPALNFVVGATNVTTSRQTRF